MPFYPEFRSCLVRLAPTTYQHRGHSLVSGTSATQVKGGPQARDTDGGGGLPLLLGQGGWGWGSAGGVICRPDGCISKSVGGEDLRCPLCETSANLNTSSHPEREILLIGRYMWRHSQQLRCLAALVEKHRLNNSVMPFVTRCTIIPFVWLGQTATHSVEQLALTTMVPACDFRIVVDPDNRLTLPTKII